MILGEGGVDSRIYFLSSGLGLVSGNFWGSSCYPCNPNVVAPLCTVRPYTGLTVVYVIENECSLRSHPQLGPSLGSAVCTMYAVHCTLTVKCTYNKTRMLASLATSARLGLSKIHIAYTGKWKRNKFFEFWSVNILDTSNWGTLHPPTWNPILGS